MKLSGPGTVTFGNSNQLSTTATFSANGIYVLQLTADDGEIQRSDLVEVRVETLCTVQGNCLPAARSTRGASRSPSAFTTMKLMAARMISPIASAPRPSLRLGFSASSAMPAPCSLPLPAHLAERPRERNGAIGRPGNRVAQS